jgi:hypothetical protein
MIEKMIVNLNKVNAYSILKIVSTISKMGWNIIKNVKMMLTFVKCARLWYKLDFIKDYIWKYKIKLIKLKTIKMNSQAQKSWRYSKSKNNSKKCSIKSINLICFIKVAVMALIPRVFIANAIIKDLL